MKTVSMFNPTCFRIEFSYDPAVVAQVRCLPSGRRWSPELRAWLCPAGPEALKMLRGWGFTIRPDVLAWEQQWLNPTPVVRARIDNIPGLKKKLYPFQAEGVGFLESRFGRSLIADEMGLGKTIQALAWLQHKGAPVLPALIVCPASLKGNWARECADWTTLSCRVLSGSQPAPEQVVGLDVLIVNYDILAKWLPILGSIRTVVLDEAHYIKNPKAARTKAVRWLCKGRRHVVAISGTPIVNRPAEFFTALSILDNAMFGDWWAFAKRYCNAQCGRFGWDFSGASNTDELHRKLSTLMIRRLKADVLTDLPPKTRTMIPLELNGNEGIYTSALREALGAWQDEKPDPLRDITQISALRQAALDAKFDLCCEWIDNFLETSPGKLVLFAVHHATIDRLMARYGERAVSLDGRTEITSRSLIVERFQTDPGVRLFIGNIQAAGVGITLTAAQDTAFLEFPWTPGELDQAEDRIHRIGQKGATNIYYLIAQGTLEEDILKLIEAKRKVLNGVLDGKYDESTSILAELTKRIKQKGNQ